VWNNRAAGECAMSHAYIALNIDPGPRWYIP
jgi:hypothetical protein